MKRRILITAGPTHEPIDAVRYIANRSSGALGVALAAAAQQAGWAVTLLLGPVSIDTPPGITPLRFQTTEELRNLLQQHFPQTDVLVMAAAVADYRPRTRHDGKLKRQNAGLTIELESTPDLLAACAKAKRPDQLVIGFALEEPAVMRDRARRKLKDKMLDAIVANPLATMSAADIDAVVFTAAGAELSPGPMNKTDFAQWLIQQVGQRFTSVKA